MRTDPCWENMCKLWVGEEESQYVMGQTTEERQRASIFQKKALSKKVEACEEIRRVAHSCAVVCSALTKVSKPTPKPKPDTQKQVTKKMHWREEDQLKQTNSVYPTIPSAPPPPPPLNPDQTHVMALVMKFSGNIKTELQSEEDLVTLAECGKQRKELRRHGSLSDLTLGIGAAALHGPTISIAQNTR
ncbi:hypothetical protein NQD34_005110 [Periophthalmus magnuspinnatus]|nr:hypothetical protein NQD34_005110 [Periophthalmus magnuspinnatus]